MNFTLNLMNEYKRLYDTTFIINNKLTEVCLIVDKILSNQDKYAEVEKMTNVPWELIVSIHSLESSLNFKRHFHNGDPLTGRTINVPKGRPLSNPPFTWIESAIDALKLKKWDLWKDWSIEGCLYKAEEYNGWGYRKYHSETLSPYLWSYTNHYSKGKYASDGKYDKNLVSKQCGIVPILKILEFV